MRAVPPPAAPPLLLEDDELLELLNAFTVTVTDAVPFLFSEHTEFAVIVCVPAVALEEMSTYVVNVVDEPTSIDSTVDDSA